MFISNTNIKTIILNAIYDIINFNDDNWKNIDLNIKLKLIHHYCNFFKNTNLQQNVFFKNTNLQQNDFFKNTNLQQNKILQQNTNLQNDFIYIPLKNIKPKKIIQFAGFNKQINNDLFEKYKKDILNYTREFRTNFNNKNNKIYTFNNLSKSVNDEILFEYNKINYLFLKNNLNNIDIKNLFDNLVGNNNNKLIQNNNNSIKLSELKYNNNFIELIFNNNINIKLELYLTSEKITNNIPTKYKISLINNF